MISVRVLMTIIAVGIILSLSLVLITSIDFCKKGFNVDFSLEGITTYFQAMESFDWILSTTLTLLPITLTIISIMLNTNAKEVTTLLDIRNALNLKENVEVHENLRGSSGKWVNGNINGHENWRKIDNYLGTLELCAILIKKGVISFENFKRQFGYRVHNIVVNKEIVRKIESEKSSWEDLYYLIALDTNWKTDFENNLP